MTRHKLQTLPRAVTAKYYYARHPDMRVLDGIFSGENSAMNEKYKREIHETADPDEQRLLEDGS